MEEKRLAGELWALRTLVEYDQYANWDFAWSPRLERELLEGSRSGARKEVFKLLRESWTQKGEDEDPEFKATADRMERSLFFLNLKDGDRRHLAEAMALRASWFLTNDDEIIERSEGAGLPMKIARVSDCLEEISKGLFMI